MIARPGVCRFAALAVLAAACAKPAATQRLDAGSATNVAPTPAGLRAPPVRVPATGPVGPRMVQAAADGCQPYWRELDLHCDHREYEKDPAFAAGRPISPCDPVHERLTRSSLAEILGRAAAADDPAVSEYLQGVLWNDDPAGLLTPESPNVKTWVPTDVRWCVSFRQAQTEAWSAADPASPLLNRSHFGDLQFLHAMAGRADETAVQTFGRIITWLEFTYRIGTGDISGETPLAKVPLSGIPPLFPKQARITVAAFFGTGGHGDVKARALGSLLHVIQDLYGGGHAKIIGQDPESPVIDHFFTYAKAVHPAHGGDPGWRDAWAADAELDRVPRSRQAIERGIDVLRFAQHRAPWPVVRKYLDHFLSEFENLDAKAEQWTAATRTEHAVQHHSDAPSVQTEGVPTRH